MTVDVPRPIIAQAQPVAIIRMAVEECRNRLDAAGPDIASISERGIELADGSVVTLRCSRTKQGGIRVSMTASPKMVITPARYSR